ncbi:hypothetical protein D3C87_792600 [compost metagenome]
MNHQWKTIDSAPKDGTGILGYWNTGELHDCNFRAVKFHRGAWWETNEDYRTSQPTHWMPLPAAPCPTCSDQGAVGNILTAAPCPDCSTPPASAQDDAKDDGLAEAQRLAQALFQRHFARDDDYVSGRVKWEVLGDLPGVISQIDNMVSGLVQPAAPAAGDARDAARYRWLRDPQSDVALVLDKRTGYVPADERIPGIGGYHTYEYRAGEELDTAIDEAIAASQQQEG